HGRNAMLVQAGICDELLRGVEGRVWLAHRIILPDAVPDWRPARVLAPNRFLPREGRELDAKTHSAQPIALFPPSAPASRHPTSMPSREDERERWTRVRRIRNLPTGLMEPSTQCG